MSLKTIQPPEGLSNLVVAGLNRLARQPGTSTHDAIWGVRPGELSMTLPHAVYFLGMKHLIAGQVAKGATFSGWRYIIMRKTQPLLSVGVALNSSNKTLEFTHASDSPFVQTTVEGIRRASVSKKLRKDDFDLRLLELPALNVVSLWFHSPTNDYFMPLPPVRKSLKAFQLCSEGALVRALNDAARKRSEIKNARA